MACYTRHPYETQYVTYNKDLNTVKIDATHLLKKILIDGETFTVSPL